MRLGQIIDSFTVGPLLRLSVWDVETSRRISFAIQEVGSDNPMIGEVVSLSFDHDSLRSIAQVNLEDIPGGIEFPMTIKSSQPIALESVGQNSISSVSFARHDRTLPSQQDRRHPRTRSYDVQRG